MILRIVKMSSIATMLTMLRMGEMMDTVSNESYLSPGEVARHYGVSTGTILRWARTGRLEGLRVVTLPSGQHRYVRSATGGSSEETPVGSGW
jgi:hypothetical protein